MTSDASQDRSGNLRWPSLGLLAVLMAAAALYSQTLSFGLLDPFDDGLYVLNRPEVRDWWASTWNSRILTPETGYPVPVPTFLYAHARLAAPESFPSILHGLNVAVHLVNTGLVFALIRRWEGPWFGLAVSALWGLHPAAVESVAWVTNLKTCLWLTFLLGAILLWERRLDRLEEGESSPGLTAGVGALFLLGLGCRPSMILLPAVFALLAWRRGANTGTILKRDGVALTVFALPALVYVPVAFVQHETFANDLGGADAWLRLKKGVMALGTAAQNLIVPVELMPIYPYEQGAGWLGFFPGIAALVGVCLLGVVLYLQGRRRWFAYLLFAALLWAPFSQIIDLPRMTADTYLYAPMIWLIALGVSAGRWWWNRRTRARRHTMLIGALGGALLLAFCMSTYHQIGRWRSLKTLWEPVQQRHPRLWKPYVMLGHHYRDRGEWKKAAAVLTEGYPYMKQGHFIPDFMPEVLSRVGQPRQAADVAVAAIKRHRRVEDDHYQALLGVLAGNNIPMGDDPEVVSIVEKAVDVYTSHGSWMDIRSNRLGLARYFLAQERVDLARPFLSREFESAEPNCQIWGWEEAYNSMSESPIFPPRPDRCGE